MRLGILGPLLVADDGGNQIMVAADRQRTLLAALLVRANRTVPVEELAELVWDTAPPGGAARTVRSYVMRLRRVVGPAVAARIVTRDPGYRCEVAEAELDALRFEALCRQGGAAVRARAWQQGRGLLAEALGLWRGAVLEDVTSQSLRQECTEYLEQARLRAIEWRIEADLHLGRHEELIPELQALADRYPLREHGHAQLMLALYRCERAAEALEAFQRARRVLVQEVGIEPGPELRTLQEKILAGDAGLTARQDDVPAIAAGHAPIVTPPQLSPSQRVPPRELPPAPPGFTARSAELEALTRLLNRPGEQAPETIVISAIAGTAGVGKTALAVHWAHQVAEKFPDGQLYVNLRGFDAAQPVTAAEALAGFLRALGGAGQDIPPTEAERAARYRSLLAGRRMLVLLDNARDARQVRPLLPGNPGCLALVTSRNQLAGLAAAEGAYLLTLDLLTEVEARELLARRLGGARVDAEPQAATQLIRLCARLPLALTVAAARVSVRPQLSLGALATELNDAGRRLDALDTGGDDRTAVRAVFSWSYRQLDPGTARAFRLTGLHPGPDLNAYATAALTATTLPLATQRLGQLARAHLIQLTSPGRYGMHDLLRGYSRELAGTCDDEPAQQAALNALFDYYTYTAALAMDTAFPAERHRRPATPPPPVTAAPAFGAPPAALAWLDAELPALVAATGFAARHGWPCHAIRLAATLFRYLDTTGHFPEAITIHTHARRAARRTGDRAAEADALIGLGLVHGHQGRHGQAIRAFRQALARYRQADNQTGQARALNYLGLVCGQQGNYQRASSDLQRAAALYQAAGERTGEAYALSNLGVLAVRQGRYRQAARHQQEALALLATMRDRHGQATVLERLGFIALQQGRYQQATSQLQQAQTRYRTIGDQQGQANAQAKLGAVKLRQGHYRQATSELLQALARYRQLADPSGQAMALNGLGEVFLATAHPTDARSHHAAAAALAAQASDTYEQARAQRGLACAWQACGDPCEAHRHWHQALNLYTLLGAPEADQIRGQLTITNIAPFAQSRPELGNQNKTLCSRNCRTPAAPKRRPIRQGAARRS